MTSPEWEAANEDDSDRFPQPSPHVAPTPLADPLRSDPARVARYAEATVQMLVPWLRTVFSATEDAGQRKVALEVVDCIEPLAFHHAECAPILAVADEEHSALVAEVKRLLLLLADETYREEGGRIVVGQLMEARRRAEAAEAKVAKVEADVCRFAKDAADVQTKWLAAEARSEAVEAALRRVRELHQRRGEDLPIEEDWCEADGRQWPCPTSATLSDPTPTVKDQS